MDGQGNWKDPNTTQAGILGQPLDPSPRDPLQKPTNPKDALGTTRVPMERVSEVAIAEETLAMTEGAVKYGAYNYRAIGVRTSIYLGAAKRHLAKYAAGEDRDKKTGVHHLASVRACMGIILEAQAMGKLTDDRGPAIPYFSEWLDAMEERVKHLHRLFRDHNPKHWTINDVTNFDAAEQVTSPAEQEKQRQMIREFEALKEAKTRADRDKVRTEPYDPHNDPWKKNPLNGESGEIPVNEAAPVGYSPINAAKRGPCR